jgi:hypothetical protein
MTSSSSLRSHLLIFGVFTLGVQSQWPLKCNTSSHSYSSWNETRCPATQSCAPNEFSVSGMGCCPWPNGISCGVTSCCPAATTCVSQGGSGYSEVFTCVAAAPGGPANVTSKCPCKPGPALPPSSTLKNVLIIGDSLSIGYTPYVQAALEGIVQTFHAPWDVTDGGAEEASYFNQCLDNWLHSPSGIPIKVDLIWFNSGMHNLGTSGTGVPGQGGNYSEYPAELAAVTARLEAYATSTGTKLLYALTTPFLCTAATDFIINDILNVNASAIMATNSISVVDLHTPIIEKCGAAPTPACFGLTGCWCPHCPPGYEW